MKNYYIHNIPGRLRVRTAQFKRNTCRASHLCSTLKNLNGIYKTEFNQKAGSLLVHYDSEQLTADEILYAVHKAGCLEQVISSVPSSHSTSKVGALVGNAIFGTVVKKSLQTSMLSLFKATLR